MKKRWIGLIMILCLSCIAGCGGHFSDTPSTVAFEDLPTPTPTPLPIPDHVQSFYDRVNDLIAVGEFPLAMVYDNATFMFESINSGCSFFLRGIDNDVHYKLSFIGSGQGIRKSFMLPLHFDKDSDGSKSLIAIVLMAISPSLTKESAIELANEMALDYLENKESKVVDLEEYRVFIGADDNQILRAIQQDEIFPQINKNNYPSISYNNALQGQKNYGHLYFLEGSVTSVSENKTVAGIRYTVAFLNDDDKRTYYLRYNYNDHPVIVYPGKRYKVYASVLNNAETPNEPHLLVIRLEIE